MQALTNQYQYDTVNLTLWHNGMYGERRLNHFSWTISKVLNDQRWVVLSRNLYVQMLSSGWLYVVPVYCPSNFIFIKLIYNVFLLQRQQQNGALIHRDWRVKITSSILKIKGFFIASLALYACNEYGQLYMILITILKHFT